MSYIVALALAGTLLAPNIPAQAGETLVISTIDKKVKKATKRFQPMADYLTAALASHGVDAVEIFIATDKISLVEGLNSGGIDVYFDSPLIMAEIMKDASVKPVLRRWKKGVAEYHSVYFAGRMARSRPWTTCAATALLLSAISRRPVTCCPNPTS